MCLVCRRSIVTSLAMALLPATRAGADQRFERIPVPTPHCAAPTMHLQRGELRIYGRRDDVRAARSFVIGDREIVLKHGSGDPALDQNLGEALMDILGRLEFSPREVPAVFFMDDRGSPNAIAWGASIRSGTNGTIVLGETLLRQMLTIGGAAVRALLTHEAAHLYQFKHRIETRMGDGVAGGRRLELQADYVSGWDLALFLGSSRGGLGHARAAANGMISLGTSPRTPPNEATHGTQNQRFRAFMEGWIDGASGLANKSSEAFRKGFEVAWKADTR